MKNTVKATLFVIAGLSGKKDLSENLQSGGSTKEVITMGTNKSDSLIIGYDSCGIDGTCMVIARNINGTLHIVNEFRGEEAKKMYEKLTTYNGSTIVISEGIRKKLVGDNNG